MAESSGLIKSSASGEVLNLINSMVTFSLCSWNLIALPCKNIKSIRTSKSLSKIEMCLTISSFKKVLLSLSLHHLINLSDNLLIFDKLITWVVVIEFFQIVLSLLFIHDPHACEASLLLTRTLSSSTLIKSSRFISSFIISCKPNGLRPFLWIEDLSSSQLMLQPSMYSSNIFCIARFQNWTTNSSLVSSSYAQNNAWLFQSSDHSGSSDKISQIDFIYIQTLWRIWIFKFFWSLIFKIFNFWKLKRIFWGFGTKKTFKGFEFE